MRQFSRLFLLICACLLTPAAPAQTSINPTLLVSAHRGGAAYAPENTMLAFRNATRLGADDLEADTMLSADGELVLIHDDTLDRTTNCSGFIIDWTYADLLANCDAAHYFTPGEHTTRGEENGYHPLRGKGIRLPLAHELLDYLVERYEAGERVPTATIEIKVVPDRRDEEGLQRTDPSSVPTADALVNLINEDRYALIKDRIIIQSFWPPALDLVKRLDPTIRTLFLTSFAVGALTAENLAYVTSNGHDIAAPEHVTPDLNAELVTAARQAHKRVIPWTVDKTADLERIAALGVNGMITNFPACMLRLQGRLPEGASVGPLAVQENPAARKQGDGNKSKSKAMFSPDTPACPDP